MDDGSGDGGYGDAAGWWLLIGEECEGLVGGEASREDGELGENDALRGEVAEPGGSTTVEVAVGPWAGVDVGLRRGDLSWREEKGWEQPRASRSRVSQIGGCERLRDRTTEAVA